MLKNKKNIRLWASAIAGATIMTTTGCSGQDIDVTDSKTLNYSDENTSDIMTTTTVTFETRPFTHTSLTENTIKDEEIVDKKDSDVLAVDDVEAAVTRLTAEDIVLKSREFAKHINETAILSHQYYKFSEFTPEDLYAVVYLANIDFIDKEETARLIRHNIISENIDLNMVKSFYFYELYYDDTVNKVVNGNDNIIDLSLILTNEHDKSVAKLMNKIMTDSITVDKDEIYKNYVDTVYYYANGDPTITNSDYDYSQSIYETDRDKLTAGGSYTLGFAIGSCIDEISKAHGVANTYLSNVMYSGRTDTSNIVNVAKRNGCTLSQEQEENKTLVK